MVVLCVRRTLYLYLDRVFYVFGDALQFRQKGSAESTAQ